MENVANIISNVLLSELKDDLVTRNVLKTIDKNGKMSFNSYKEKRYNLDTLEINVMGIMPKIY